MAQVTYVGVEALGLLYEEYETCELCPALCTRRTGIVFGSGSSRAKVLVVGEAPGEDEDLVGVPFVGASGQRLMAMMARALPQTPRLAEIRQIRQDDAFHRTLREYLDEFMFFTNVVMCRPTDEETGKNRKPTTQEIKNCKERLTRLIYAVDPDLIIAAGKKAAAALLGKSLSIVNENGRIYDIRLDSPVTGKPVRYAMMAMVHPSYLLQVGDDALIAHKKGKTYETIQALSRAFQLLNTHSEQVDSEPFPSE